MSEQTENNQPQQEHEMPEATVMEGSTEAKVGIIVSNFQV